MALQASLSSSPNFTNSSIDSIIEIYKELLKQLKKLRIEFTQSREDENIEIKCKSLERKLKREKFIREGIPHCSNCVKDTTNIRCLQCIPVIKRQKRKKAKSTIKRFIIKNYKNIIMKLKEKRKQEEIVPVKIYVPYKDRAKNYARKNKIYFEYKKGHMGMDTWWCKRKYLELFHFNFQVKLYMFELL
jgi:hypothetical protein